MVQKNLTGEYSDIYSKLKSMQNTKERTSSEHIKLYNCYVNQIQEAVT